MGSADRHGVSKLVKHLVTDSQGQTKTHVCHATLLLLLNSASSPTFMLAVGRTLVYRGEEWALPVEKDTAVDAHLKNKFREVLWRVFSSLERILDCDAP